MDGSNILVSGKNKHVSITSLGIGHVKLFLSFGSNSRSVQYINFRFGSERISETFLFPSSYADYIDCGEGYHLIAYFGYSIETEMESVLIIRNIYDADFYVEIRRDFISLVTGANRMVFLNENEIFIDYDTFTASGELKNIREIVEFRSELQ